MKKRFSLLMALLLLSTIALTGCGGKKTMEPAPTAETAPVDADGQWLGQGGCYKLERTDLSGDFMQMKGSGDKAILVTPFDGFYDTDGSSLGVDWCRDYAVSSDGIWYVREQESVDGRYTGDCFMAKLDFNGQELFRFDLSVGGDSLAIDGDGRIYVYDAMDYKLGIFGQDGSDYGLVDISAAPLEQFSAKLRLAGDGSVWLLNDVQSGLTIYPLDGDAMSLGVGYVLPEDTAQLYTGTAEHPLLLKTDSELCSYDPTSGQRETILVWDECGLIPGELTSFIPDGDGFLCLTATGLARLRPAKPDEIKLTTRLTMGVTSPYVGEVLAARFNAQSEDYSVEVVDYSDGGALSMKDAQMKLNTELISGGGPDMIYCYDTGDYRGGMLMDIYPLIDADSMVSRDDFYLLSAIERDGKLYQAPASVSIQTFGALPETVGDRTGWTWDEYFAIQDTLPPDGMMFTFLRSDFFLQTSLALYAPTAIDWENGVCNFDTPQFVRILQAALDGYDPDCPDENPYFFDEANALMNEGKLVLRSEYLIEPASLAQDEASIGRDLSYVGWPTPDGSCGSTASVSGPVISANTDSPEGCWQFAKYVMKNTYVYKPLLEKALSEAMASKTVDGVAQPPALTERQANWYRTLMSEIQVCTSTDSVLSDIVVTEAAAMFAGDKTPEETAKNIQSKLSIYVAEHG